MAEPNVSELRAEDENAPVENVTTVDLAAQVTALTAERDQLIAEKAELQDLAQRRQAEFDNFRRRTERERSDFTQYAGMELVRELLPVVDDFERAVKTAGDQTNVQGQSAQEYAKGIAMIHQRLLDILKKSGVEPIQTEGKEFDPHFHQAVERVESADSPDHFILGEFQKGYLYKGKLLRPSMVKVAVH